MKRTIITIKTIDNDNTIKAQSRILLKEPGKWWNGNLQVKIKDGRPVDAEAPVKKVTIEKIPLSAYLNADNSVDEKKIDINN